MNFKDISLYNDLGFKVYDGKIYNGGYTNKEIVFPFKHKERWEKINVIFLSKGFPGKTCLIRRIEGKEFPKEMPPETVLPELIYFKYQYNNNKYELELYDTTGMERFKPISLLYARRCELIIYLFDLSKDDDLSEEFINEIKNNSGFINKVIYLVGNKLDITNKNIKKYRKQAKKLIDRGMINKYFELCAKSNEGIDFFLNNLKIDSAIMFDKDIPEPLNEKNFEKKYCIFNKNNKRDIETKNYLFKYLSL